jgi:hypothetical protein
MGFCFNINNRDAPDYEGIYHLFSSQVLLGIYQQGETGRLNRSSFVRWCRNTKLAQDEDTAIGLWREHKYAANSPLWTAFEEAVVRTKIREMTGDEIVSFFGNKINGLGELNE